MSIPPVPSSLVYTETIVTTGAFGSGTLSSLPPVSPATGIGAVCSFSTADFEHAVGARIIPTIISDTIIFLQNFIMNYFSLYSY